MKKLSSLIFILIIFSAFAAAQDSAYQKNTRTQRPPQAIYAELGGAGLFFSLNYDRRFTKRADGFGFRLGIGSPLTGEYAFTSIPLGINYLLGGKRNFFEVGLNTTPIFFKANKFYPYAYSLLNSFDFKNGNWVVFETLNIGYRYQPARQGIGFRAGISPVIILGYGARFWAYLSLGYSF